MGQCGKSSELWTRTIWCEWWTRHAALQQAHKTTALWAHQLPASLPLSLLDEKRANLQFPPRLPHLPAVHCWWIKEEQIFPTTTTFPTLFGFIIKAWKTNGNNISQLMLQNNNLSRLRLSLEYIGYGTGCRCTSCKDFGKEKKSCAVGSAVALC